MSRSFLFGDEIEAQDMFREQEDLSAPKTCLATPFIYLEKVMLTPKSGCDSERVVYC